MKRTIKEIRFDVQEIAYQTPDKKKARITIDSQRVEVPLEFLQKEPVAMGLHQGYEYRASLVESDEPLERGMHLELLSILAQTNKNSVYTQGVFTVSSKYGNWRYSQGKLTLTIPSEVELSFNKHYHLEFDPQLYRWRKQDSMEPELDAIDIKERVKK